MIVMILKDNDAFWLNIRKYDSEVCRDVTKTILELHMDGLAIALFYFWPKSIIVEH